MPGANGSGEGGAERSASESTQNRKKSDPFWVREYVCSGESGYARRISSMRIIKGVNSGH